MSFAGMLSETIEIQKRSNVGTSFQPVWDWDSEFELNGLIVTMSERNKVYDEGHKLLADHKLYIEYSSNSSTIGYNDRIKWGSNLYSIYEIKNPNQLNRHLEIKLKLLHPGASESGS